MEGGGGTHRTDGLVLVHSDDVEVHENMHHYCCSHLHIGSGVQHSRAWKMSILKLTFFILSQFRLMVDGILICE
jgi:hypothetical protein